MQLPERPNLRHLRDQAKDLVLTGEVPTLAVAQLQIARQYGPPRRRRQRTLLGLVSRPLHPVRESRAGTAPVAPSSSPLAPAPVTKRPWVRNQNPGEHPGSGPIVTPVQHDAWAPLFSPVTAAMH